MSVAFLPYNANAGCWINCNVQSLHGPKGPPFTPLNNPMQYYKGAGPIVRLQSQRWATAWQAAQYRHPLGRF
jgi:hypothetical protein